jgi:hypothetical protein
LRGLTDCKHIKNLSTKLDSSLVFIVCYNRVNVFCTLVYKLLLQLCFSKPSISFNLRIDIVLEYNFVVGANTINIATYISP